MEKGNNKILWTAAAVFMITIAVYVFTLAPTVTFEDSGELITAACVLGVPHEPGYPLWTMLAHLFTYLPIGTVAWRVNFASAFFGAMGAALIGVVAHLWLDKTNAEQNENRSVGMRVSLVSAFSGIMAGTGFKFWEQSIIAEVYGLHAFFTALMLTLALIWYHEPDDKRRSIWFNVACFSLGLSLTTHPTTVLLVPVFLIFIFSADRPFLKEKRNWASAVAFVLLGLTPMLYLPIASSRNPVMDWGNPETLTNFWRVITRHQYQIDESQSAVKFLAQWKAYLGLTKEEWFPWILVLILPGLWASWKRARPLFWLALSFLFFSGPVTTYLTNFDVTGPNPVVSGENRALVSVFYIPSYMMIALLCGVGLFEAGRLLRNKTAVLETIVYGAACVVIGYSAWRNGHNVSMRSYYFAQDYVENLFRVVPPNAIVMGNWDPLVFPLFYYQHVEEQRPDIFSLDQELLRRSWYLRSLRDHRPEAMRLVQRETDEFLEAVRPFEAGEPYDGNFIQKKYEAMINALIDRWIGSGYEVYLTYDPPPGIASTYVKESVLVAVRLRDPKSAALPVSSDSLNFRHFSDPDVPKDRMARFFKNYYGRLHWARAMMLRNTGADPAQTQALLEKTLIFFDDNPQATQQIREALQALTFKP